MASVKKYMALIVLAFLVLSQVGIAQHNTVHFTDHAHQQDEHNNKQSRETCQICLSAKSFSLGLKTDFIALTVLFTGHYSVQVSSDIALSNEAISLYNPRAPPAFLI